MVLLEDVAETSSACDGSDFSGSGTFVSSASDVSSSSIMSYMSCIGIHFNDDLDQGLSR